MAFDKTARETEWAKPKFQDYIKVGLKTTGGWPDIPMTIGHQYEGERITAANMFCEFGGPKVEYKGELLSAKSADEIEDEKVTVIGPDMDQMKEGGSYPLAFKVDIAGDFTEDLAVALSTRIHYWSNYIQGLMHLNTGDTIWVRVSKDLVKRGFKLEYWGKVVARLFKAEIAKVKKAQVTIITDPEQVKAFATDLHQTIAERIKQATSRREEDISTWYSCTLCQSFAPSNVCTISPERPGPCGAVNWATAKAGYEMDPYGTWQPFNPGECLDSVRGEWAGVNQMASEKSGGINSRFYLHSIFGYPNTVCGCFEAVGFYLHEVDGVMVCDRKFTKPTVSGLTFSTLAARASGGQQMDGMVAISRAYMRSRKFIQAEGGWERIVWMPYDLKEEMITAIPEGLREKIPTEKEASNLEQLKEFLTSRKHPVVGRWKAPKTSERVLKYLEDHGGELDVADATSSLGITEDDLMKALDELRSQGIVE